MTEVVCKNRKPNPEKLLSFGFSECGGIYRYSAELASGQLRLTVTVDTDGRLYTDVTDCASGEEYVLHRVAGAAGAFVGQVREEYEAILQKITDTCLDPAVFQSPQAAEILAYVWDTYGDAFEYLWVKFPDNAIVRRRDNRKWYAAILTVSRRKLGFDSDEMAEILDLRLNPAEMERTMDHVRYFPGYHMNKKHWITICLDGTVPLDEICRRIDESCRLAAK